MNVENSTHRCPIKPTGAALESNQRWLNPSYWWIYQPLAEVPEAPGFVVRPYCQLSLRSSTRNPNPSPALNHLLTTLISTSRLQKRGFRCSFIPVGSTEAHFIVELGTFLLSRGFMSVNMSTLFGMSRVDTHPVSTTGWVQGNTVVTVLYTTFYKRVSC